MKQFWCTWIIHSTPVCVPIMCQVLCVWNTYMKTTRITVLLEYRIFANSQLPSFWRREITPPSCRTLFIFFFWRVCLSLIWCITPLLPSESLLWALNTEDGQRGKHVNTLLPRRLDTYYNKGRSGILGEGNAKEEWLFNRHIFMTGTFILSRVVPCKCLECLERGVGGDEVGGKRWARPHIRKPWVHARYSVNKLVAFRGWQWHDLPSLS